MTVFSGEVEEERKRAYLCPRCHRVSGCMADISLHAPGLTTDECAACGDDRSVWRCFGFRHIQTPEQARMRKDKGYG